MTPVTASEKWTVRRTRRGVRRDIAAGRDRAADARRLAEHGLALVDELGIVAGDAVTLYEPMPGEPPVEDLGRAMVGRGIRVIVPITRADFDLDWREYAGPALGIAAVAETRLALVPGLTVADDGTRMGQGGGCYDRVILRVADGVPVVVVLHPGEWVPTLPREPHDQPVDGVLTADGVRWIGSPPATSRSSA